MTDHPNKPDDPEAASPLAISKEDLMQLPMRRYEGTVHLVKTPSELEAAREALLAEKVVGLDTETRPSFRKGESYLPSLAQVATANAVYLFPLKRLDCSEVLIELLQNRHVAKAGIGLRDDFSKLRLRYAFEEKRIVELSEVAKRHGMGQPSARNLTALFLGFRITKGQSTSNWARSELTPQQIFYAATDAWVCRELYFCFRERGIEMIPQDFKPKPPPKGR
jgi:ribonuclease D